MLDNLKLGRQISIHALRGEGDKSSRLSNETRSQFQSTPSVGRATISEQCSSVRPSFQSTPSVGRATLLHMAWISQKGDFNPRPPWGGRL